MSQDAESAIEVVEVTDVQSAADEIERRMTASEEPTEEVAEVEEVEDQNLNPDEEAEPEVDEAETSDEEETELEQESEDQEPETEESETPDFQNLAEIAEAIGMPLDEFMANIKTTRKINGVEEEVTLAEQRDGNQRDADYRHKTTAHADVVREFNSWSDGEKAKLGQQFQEVAAMTTNLEQQLMGEFNSIDWNALELEDREEWLVQRQKFGERAQQIETVKSQVGQQLNEQQQEIQAKQSEATQLEREENGRLLLDNIPEWQDQEVWKQDDKGMRTLLSDYGFSEGEVNNSYDHRMIRMVRDLMKLKSKTGKIDVAKKKVKKLPKILKPSMKPDKVSIQGKQKQDARRTLKKNGNDINEVAKYLEGLM